MAATLQFILGAAGSGKSAELTGRLVEALSRGGREMLLVPEQSVVAAETRLAELTEGIDSTKLEVVSFTRLCNLVFRRLGGLCYNYADAGARTVAMWRTLDELSGLLVEYKITPEGSRRWAQLLLDEYTYLRTRGITPAMLEGAAKRLPPEHARLAGKLTDLALVGATYSRLLCELYDDPSEDISRATELLRGTDFFAGRGIWLDSFDGFTHEQYELLREILRSAERVTVALQLPDGSRSPAFDTVRQTKNTLLRLAAEVGAEVAQPVVMRGLPRYKSPELARVAAMLWEEGAAGNPEESVVTAAETALSGELSDGAGNSAPSGELSGGAGNVTSCSSATCDGDGNAAPSGDTSPDGAGKTGDAPRCIRIVECADRYEEAELAAAEIARHVQSGGRWRDCAVIARNIADYDGIIDAALERVGAPYFMSARTDVSSRPVVKLALAALAVVAGGWRRTDIMEMLRTGMAGITPEECDVLEEYLVTWNISGERRWRAEHEWRMNPDGYTDELSPRGERILATVNAVRAKIVPPLAALADSFRQSDADGLGDGGERFPGESGGESASALLNSAESGGESASARHYAAVNGGESASARHEAAEGGGESTSARREAAEDGWEDHSSGEYDSPARPAGNVRRAAAGLYSFLCELGVPDRLQEKEGELAHQLWQAIVGALDTIVTVAGGATVNADRFSQIFDTVLRRATVARIPVSVDCVMVGQSDRLRVGDIKLAVLLGASEGVFPAKVEASDEIFSSSELRVLREVGIDPRDDAEYIASQELLGFYRAAASPSERLVITFAPSERGSEPRPAKPSPGIERLCAMFPGLRVEKFSDLPPSERVWSRETALELAASQPDTPEGRALRELLSADPQATVLLEAASRPLAEPEAALSPELAAEIFRGDLALTQSRLESYILCSFAFYCRYMLGLREQPRAEFGGVDRGNFTHRVLERFMRAVTLPDGRIDPSLSREERARLADEIIEEYIEQTFGPGEERSARAQHLFRRLRRTTLLVIENIAEELSQSEFVPCRLELPITHGEAAPDGGPAVAPLRIPLPGGGSAFVYGKIDRVDVYRRGRDVYLRVVDYKTGTQKFSLSDLALGLNMQLLLYLLSLWNGGKSAVGAPDDARILPAGMIYMSAGAPRVEAQPGEDAAEVEDRAADQLKRTGILLEDEGILRAMEKNLEEKFIPVSLKKTGGFKKRGVTLASLAGFGKLMRDAENIVAGIAAEMKSGEASAHPLREKRQGGRDACRWCPYGPVCRTRKRERA